MPAFSAGKEGPRVMTLFFRPRPRPSPDVMLASIHDNYLLKFTENLHYVIRCECDRDECAAEGWKDRWFMCLWVQISYIH